MVAISPPQAANGGIRGFVGQQMLGKRPSRTYFPLQPETVAYVQQGSSPSIAWFDHLNTLIYRLKQNGAWSPLLAGYLFCAETENLALADLKGRKRATKTGAPTFISGQGYGGTFDSSNYIDVPVSDVDTGAAQSAKLFAGLLNATQAASTYAGTGGQIVGSGGVSSGLSFAALDYDATGSTGVPPGFLMQGSLCSTANGPLICAKNGSFSLIYPGCFGGNTGTSSASFTSLRTGTLAGGILVRYCSMLCFSSTANDVQVEAAALALSTFLYDTGALP